MIFTTISEVRDSTNKIKDTVDVPDTLIENRIEAAEKKMIADLSGCASKAELEAMGSNSETLSNLATYKSVELTLVRVLGASRQADTVSDVQYWEKQYSVLLLKVKNGEVEITDGTTSLSPVNIPVATSNNGNAKMYPEKGVSGFINDGAKTDIVEDRVK